MVTHVFQLMAPSGAALSARHNVPTHTFRRQAKFGVHIRVVRIGIGIGIGIDRIEIIIQKNCNSNSFCLSKRIGIAIPILLYVENGWNCNSNSFVCRKISGIAIPILSYIRTTGIGIGIDLIFSQNLFRIYLQFHAAFPCSLLTYHCSLCLLFNGTKVIIVYLRFSKKKTDMKLETQSILINSNQFQWNWNWESEISRNWSELELELSSFWKSKRIGIGIEWFSRMEKELGLELSGFWETKKNWNWNWLDFWNWLTTLVVRNVIEISLSIP